MGRIAILNHVEQEAEHGARSTEHDKKHEPRIAPKCSIVEFLQSPLDPFGAHRVELTLSRAIISS